MPTVASDKVFASSAFNLVLPCLGIRTWRSMTGKLLKVDWKHAVDCLHKQNARCSVEDSVSIGSTALHDGRILG